MLVWINGTFGVGKSSLATRLAEQWPGAILVDPEDIGVMLMRWSGPHGLGVPDFQDLALWRELVVHALAGLDAELGRPMVVPMTMLDPAYFDQVVGGLRARGLDVRHVCLTAPRDEVIRRLGARTGSGGDPDPAAMAWALERLDRYAPATQDARFGPFLDATLPRDELLAQLLRLLSNAHPAPTGGAVTAPR